MRAGFIHWCVLCFRLPIFHPSDNCKGDIFIKEGRGSDGGRAGSLTRTHNLSAENKALCSCPCERACQRKADGLPLSASPSQRKHKSSAGAFDGAGQPHKSQRRVLVAVRAAERRPVKASLTASIGEAVKNGDVDFIFLTKETPDTFSLFVFLYLRHLGHTHLEVRGCPTSIIPGQRTIEVSWSLTAIPDWDYH